MTSEDTTHNFSTRTNATLRCQGVDCRAGAIGQSNDVRFHRSVLRLGFGRVGRLEDVDEGLEVVVEINSAAGDGEF